MAEQKIIKAVIQFRRGIAEDWVRVNPVLREGEPGFEIDAGGLKIGDGIRPWNELEYITAQGIDVDDELSPISVNPVQNKVITQTIQSIEDELGLIKSRVMYGTTAYWDEQTELIAKENAIYVYTDGFPRAVHNIVRFKVGDGQSRLIDLPYTDMVYYDHISDPIVHVTPEERDFWNNKVSCRIEGETINFSTSRV
jgi:hypothetical protein